MVHKTKKPVTVFLVNYEGGQKGVFARTAKQAKESFRRHFPNKRIIGKISNLHVKVIGWR